MVVTTFVNNLFDSNTYAIESGVQELILVDPCDNPALWRFLEEKTWKAITVLLTHEHIDHISGTNRLKQVYPECVIICSAECAAAIIYPKKNLSAFYNLHYASVPADIILENDSIRNIAGSEWQFFLYGGHSAGGMFLQTENLLFVGDQFIKDTKTVTKLPGGSKKQYLSSYDFIKTKYPARTLIYPGHGPAFTVGELKLW